MKITADTNLLVRAVLMDDARQARAAARLLREATLIAVPLPALCEFVWVLRRGAGLAQEDIVAAIEALLRASNVTMNRPAVEAGLALFKAGGDLADGAMAHEGRWLGGEVFVSFDKTAVKLLNSLGQAAKLAV
ncbi:type II toxin-antitoxin system VapC family toxin [Aestuariivirga sp.]|uniref:type II toxin-antitoxin system VapC family toxin n=1 Tax=Aestuariivirga sp. TaxID=2650926 RepID=UPI0039E293CF